MVHETPLNSPRDLSAAAVPNFVAWRDLNRVFEQIGTVNDATLSSDGRFALTMSSDGTARVWDVATGITLAVLYSSRGALNSGSFSPRDSFVAVGGDDGKVRIYACDVCAPVPGERPLGKWPPLGAAG